MPTSTSGKAQAQPRQRGELVGQHQSRGQNLASRHEAIGEPHPQGLLRPDRPTGEHQVHRQRLADQPREPNGAAIARSAPAGATYDQGDV